MSDELISLNQVLNTVFDSNQTKVVDNVVAGTGKINNTRFKVIGTIENTSFGVDEAIHMAREVLGLLKTNDHSPLLLLVDVAGQKLAKRDEWLGMYAYFAHLLKCLHLVRQQGNPIISLIYNQAVGGSFIAFGMMADRIYALSHAKLAVMWLEGMASVTKIDIDVLKKISETSPVFAPGADNFKKLGGLHKVLALEDVKNTLLTTLEETSLSNDNRLMLGEQYKGRCKAYDIIKALERL